MTTETAVETFPWRVRGDGVAVLPREAETVSRGGIHLVAGGGTVPMVGEVVGVGPEVSDISVGQVVLFSKYSGLEVEVKFRGRRVVFLAAQHVKMVLQDPSAL